MITTREYEIGDNVITRPSQRPGLIVRFDTHDFCGSCHCCPPDPEHRGDGSLCCPGPWYVVSVDCGECSNVHYETYAEHELAPPRVRIEGDLYHQRVPEGAVKVTRPGKWGNPHPIDKPCEVEACNSAVHAREESLRLFREYLDHNPELVAQARRELKNRFLACWCKPDEECHADIWLEYIARPEPV